jgi:hypothetical protein
LGLLAEDWATPPAQVAEQIGRYAVDAATREARVHTVRTPDPT